MKIIERSLQEIGKSLLVTLPSGWTKSSGLKKGSKIKIMVNDTGSLSIAPEFTKQEKKKETVIEYDESFKRRFFKEYFEGNEKISIKIEKISEKEKKQIYEFIKRFMNIQIIEENAGEIVLKCFRIDELSAVECLKRMYSLSLGMFEEKTELDEIRDAITRFYYLLVMQVRRFLSEGKFADENQISLLRAMDIRMVAEKIQRVAEILEKNRVSDKEIKEYYSKAFNYFIEENFEKSLALWKEGNSLIKKYEKKNNEISQIIRFGKEISMLVR